MPMKKISTLIFLVNKIKSELELTQNKIVNNQFEILLTGMENIEKTPSDGSIKKILDFARSYEVLETKETGFVEVILN